MWPTFLSLSLALSDPAPRKGSPRRWAFRRPVLEVLEDRTLPSTLTVLNVNDSGPGSLRDTIAASRNGDTINFDPSLEGQTITLTSGELVIDHSLDIEGPGGNHLPVTISGNDASRVFDVTNSTAFVTLANLDIMNGLASEGGGLMNQGGTVSLSHCNVIFNQAQGDQTSSGNALGGGVSSMGGALTLDQCVVADNEAVAAGGNSSTQRIKLVFSPRHGPYVRQSAPSPAGKR
jgi:hypothetical protein